MENSSGRSFSHSSTAGKYSDSASKSILRCKEKPEEKMKTEEAEPELFVKFTLEEVQNQYKNYSRKPVHGSVFDIMPNSLQLRPLPVYLNEPESSCTSIHQCSSCSSSFSLLGSFQLTPHRCKDYEIIMRMPESVFKRLFKVKQFSVLRILEHFNKDGAQLETPEVPFIKMAHLLIFLNYLITGELGFKMSEELRNCDLYEDLMVSTSKVHKIVLKLSRLFANEKSFLNFPRSSNKQEHIVEEFRDTYGICNVLGAIDCLHVAVDSPEEDDESTSTSVIVEAICDAHLMFRSVRIGAGCLDKREYFNSNPIRMALKHRLSKVPYVYDLNWFICDSAYGAGTFLLTPYESPRRSYEKAFNILHASVFHSTIHHALILLKSKFKCLTMDMDKPMPFLADDAGYIISSTFAVYNLLFQCGDISLDEFKCQPITLSPHNDSAHKCPITDWARDRFAKTLYFHKGKVVCDFSQHYKLVTLEDLHKNPLDQPIDFSLIRAKKKTDASL